MLNSEQQQLEGGGNNIYLKNVQEILNNRSKEIFKNLADEMGSGTNEIYLDHLRTLISSFGDEANMKTDIKQLISNYHVIENILNNSVSTDKISQEEFCDFLSGKEIKKLLFESNIDEKRQKVEYFYKLFTIMGGTNNGISADCLNKCIIEMRSLYEDPDKYINSSSSSLSVDKKTYVQEAQELINLLSMDKSDKLSLEDYINIMTSTSETHIDQFILDK